MSLISDTIIAEQMASIRKLSTRAQYAPYIDTPKRLDEFESKAKTTTISSDLCKQSKPLIVRAASVKRGSYIFATF